MSVITLTTDFGTADWFAGAMKGVILRISPKASIVDITHEIPPGDIRSGALTLAAAYRFFPRKTVHVAVVDPGVGSGRAMIAVRTNDFYFVGPDNGLLSLALAEEPAWAIHRLKNQRYFLPSVSNTFHGRDVFAPVAAHLSKGVPVDRMGPRVSDFCRLALPLLTKTGKTIKAEIIHIDRFGNALTNITKKHLSRGDSSRVRVKLPSREHHSLALETFYGAVPTGTPLALIGSTGFLEVAVNGGSAAEQLRLKVGDSISLQFVES